VPGCATPVRRAYDLGDRAVVGQYAPEGFAGPKQCGDVDGSSGFNADTHLAVVLLYAEEKNGKTEIPAICGQESSGILSPPATLCCAIMVPFGEAG